MNLEQWSVGGRGFRSGVDVSADGGESVGAAAGD
jgi:hypothetical protein